ncbi:hypothetical protein JYQ62_22765 [Nostoc sp. UHCC 0702]|nr:hypothetical protein JYQ62_22765 [Nostoc sp. UHCC 0702]
MAVMLLVVFIGLIAHCCGSSIADLASKLQLLSSNAENVIVEYRSKGSLHEFANKVIAAIAQLKSPLYNTTVSLSTYCILSVSQTFS